MDNQSILEFLTSFEEVAAGKNSMIRIGDLVINKQYRISQFRFLNTSNGKCVAVDYEDGTWSILPHRLSSLVKTKEQIDALTNKNYSMFYKGRDETRMNMAILEFHVVPVATFNISEAGVPVDLISEIMEEMNREDKPKTKKMKR